MVDARGTERSLILGCVLLRSDIAGGVRMSRQLYRSEELRVD